METSELSRPEWKPLADRKAFMIQSGVSSSGLFSALVNLDKYSFAFLSIKTLCSIL